MNYPFDELSLNFTFFKVSIAERITTTSGNGCSTARIRILSRGESASFLSVGAVVNFSPQQTISSRRQSRIILGPTMHRPSRHSLLEAKRSGENIDKNKVSEQQRRHSNEEKILKKEEEIKKVLILKEEECCEYKFEDGDLEI